MKRMLLKLARLPLLGWLVGWCIAHLAHVLPLRIVTEDKSCIAFHHPSPSYDVHLLIMLKKQAKDISRISAAQIDSILSAADASVENLRLSAPHIMLWTNAGRFQDVRQLHFHLFPSEIDREADLRDVCTFSLSGASIRECIRGDSAMTNLLILCCDTENLVTLLPELIERYHLDSRGYSIFWDISERAERRNRLYIRMG